MGVNRTKRGGLTERKKIKNVGEEFENKHITKRAEIFYINQNTAPPHKNVEVLLYILIISPTASSDTP